MRNIEDEYRRAWEDYRKRWQEVDRDLYALASRRGNRRFEDVYPKVVLINRVYSAGLARSLGAAGEDSVAQHLVSAADAFEDVLSQIPQGSTLSDEALPPILNAHAAVAGIERSQGGKWLHSFASKYLNFHRPCVPISDDRARASMARWTLQVTTPARPTVSARPNWDPEYRRNLMKGMRDPAAEVARKFGAKPGTARAWVSRARKYGYLKQTGKGTAGEAL
jgi:transposase-like protein